MRIWDRIKTADPIAVVLMAIGIALAIVAFWAKPAKADTVGSGSSIAGPVSALGSGTFSGCGIGVGWGYVPNIGGHIGSVQAGCDVQAGQVVFGGQAEYGMAFGDLGDAGLDSDLTLRGRAGFVVAPNTLLFGHAGWARLEGGGLSTDGWKFGPGVSINFPNSRVFLEGRYDYGTWDDMPDTHSVAVHLVYKLGK
jgi:hypothetical protein